MVPQLWDSRVKEEQAAARLQFCLLIYFRDRLFKYPFSFTNALKHLGPIDTVLTGLSYLQTWLNKQNDSSDETAETWLKKQYGTHLYNIFFASYLHKLWGRHASTLHADCAMETVRRLTGAETTYAVPPTGPIIHRLKPPAPPNVQAAAARLAYRSLIVVELVLDQRMPFSEREICVHSSDVRVSSIQNQKTGISLSYLCDQEDLLWHMDDDELVQLARDELLRLWLIPEGIQLSRPGKVLRQTDAYPVRDVNYYRHEAVVLNYLHETERLKPNVIHSRMVM